MGWVLSIGGGWVAMSCKNEMWGQKLKHHPTVRSYVQYKACTAPQLQHERVKSRQESVAP